MNPPLQRKKRNKLTENHTNLPIYLYPFDLTESYHKSAAGLIMFNLQGFNRKKLTGRAVRSVTNRQRLVCYGGPEFLTRFSRLSSGTWRIKGYFPPAAARRSLGSEANNRRGAESSVEQPPRNHSGSFVARIRVRRTVRCCFHAIEEPH